MPGDLTADFGDNAVENMQLKVRRGGANQAAHKQKPLAAAAIEGTASIMDVRCHCGSANCDGSKYPCDAFSAVPDEGCQSCSMLKKTKRIEADLNGVSCHSDPKHSAHYDMTRYNMRVVPSVTFRS